MFKVSSIDTQEQADEVNKKVTDYDKLAQAVNYFNGAEYATAAAVLSEVDKKSLSEQAGALYQTLRQNLSEYMQQDQPEGQGQTEGQDLSGEVQDGMDPNMMGDMTGEGLY